MKKNTTHEGIADTTLNRQQHHTPNTEIPDKPPLLFSKRMFIVILICLCFFNFTLIQCNIYTAIVEMTSAKKIIKNNATILYPAEYDWDSKTIGLITSLTAYGGMLTFIGGFFTNKFGGLIICVISLMICGVTTFLQPFCLHLNFQLFLACRFILGIFNNFTMISALEILSHWIPKREKSTLLSFTASGSALGQTLVNSLCGYLAYTFGWRMIFYVTGTMACMLSVLCLIFIKDSPSQDKWMSNKERLYILSQTDSISKKQFETPYKNLLSSSPIWVLIVVNMGTSWTHTITGTTLPLYIADITEKNIKDVGLFSSIPLSVSIFTTPIAGALMDFWNNHTTTSISRIHKIIMGVGHASQAALLIIIMSIPNFTTSTTAFTLIKITTSTQQLILQFININIAPSSTGVVVGFTSFAYCLGIIMAQISLGFMRTGHTRDEWNNCFLLTCAITAICAVAFTLKGSSEPQPWAIQSACTKEHTASEKTQISVKK